jgi:hypothetical protein
MLLRKYITACEGIHIVLYISECFQKHFTQRNIEYRGMVTNKLKEFVFRSKDRLYLPVVK